MHWTQISWASLYFRLWILCLSFLFSQWAVPFCTFSLHSSYSIFCLFVCLPCACQHISCILMHLCSFFEEVWASSRLMYHPPTPSPHSSCCPNGKTIVKVQQYRRKLKASVAVLWMDSISTRQSMEERQMAHWTLKKTLEPHRIHLIVTTPLSCWTGSVCPPPCLWYLY